MNFVSQCIWAGFGGSNSVTDINNGYGMDKAGTHVWWASSTTGTSSWASCSNFRNYVSNSKGASEKGLICDTGDVAYNSDQIPFTASDLIGSAIHVKGYNGSTPIALGHAVFVNNATGSTRNTVYYTAYNNCRKNRLLSLSYPSSTTDVNNRMFVIVPRTFKEGSTDTRLWSDLHNATAINTTVTLRGYSNVQCKTFDMQIYNPNGDLRTTYNFSNTNSISANYNGFNMTGAWTIVLTGVDSSNTTKKFTYIVRIY